MDANMERKLDEWIAELSGAERRSEGAELIYRRALDYSWKPYAVAHSLPTDFAVPGGRPLSEDEIASLLLAAKTGELRRGTREGTRTDRLGTPLAPTTVDILISALRRAHEQAGLAWVGGNASIRELRTGYARENSKPSVHATPLLPAHVQAMFLSAPSAASRHHDEARCRAVALALGLTLDAASQIRPEDVIWALGRMEVKLGPIRIETRCLRGRLDDAITAAACAHCTMHAWLHTAAPRDRLLPQRKVPLMRSRCLRLAQLLPHLVFDHDSLVVPNQDLWTAIAVGLEPEAAAWLLARAVLLPMRATGMKVDDFDGLDIQHVVFNDESAIISLDRNHPRKQPTDITVVRTGGALCPFSALLHYDSWARAYLPGRRCFIVPSRGKGLRYPVDVEAPKPGGRALDQRIRIWLHDQAIEIDNTMPGQRRSLTPSSARRGFAIQANQEGRDLAEIQRNLRHRRVDTTSALLAQSDPPHAPTQLLNKISADTNE